jgi:hypothetical protein
MTWEPQISQNMTCCAFFGKAAAAQPVSVLQNGDRKWTASIRTACLAQNWVLGVWNNMAEY